MGFEPLSLPQSLSFYIKQTLCTAEGARLGDSLGGDCAIFGGMDRNILPSEQWANSEFGSAQLQDSRRTERLVFMATRLAEHPGGTLPQAFPEWAELKAAYRFISQPTVTYEHIQTPHWERSRAECAQPGEYLIIEDTSALDYTGHPAEEEVGVIGDGRGRGFHLHSSLAVQVQGWSAEQRPQVRVVGLVAQQCLCPRPAPEGEKRSDRYYRPRQSQRWASELMALGRPRPGCRWVYTADREADFYEPIQQCQQLGWDFLIRSSHDRRLDGESEHLRAAVAQAPLQGTMRVELRARPGQAARTAQVAVRSRAVELSGPWRPGGWQPGIRANVVEVSEINPPAQVEEPLHWILLTSLTCDTWSEVQRVVGRYATRWLIEEYHKALQSGTKVEESQLERGYRLETLLSILAVVAVRLLSTKLLARTQPDEPIKASEFGAEALEILEAKYGKPEKGWTYLSLLVAIARMGGFLARKHDGMPGWQTIWRGWQRLMTMCEGLAILNEAQRRLG